MERRIERNELSQNYRKKRRAGTISRFWGQNEERFGVRKNLGLNESREFLGSFTICKSLLGEDLHSFLRPFLANSFFWMRLCA